MTVCQRYSLVSDRDQESLKNIWPVTVSFVAEKQIRLTQIYLDLPVFPYQSLLQNCVSLGVPLSFQRISQSMRPGPLLDLPL